MNRLHAPAPAEPVVTNMRGDRAFDRQSGKVVCRETPFLQRVLILALAAAVLGTAANAAPAPAKPAAHAAKPGYHIQHRSIWAAKWAAAHPAEEAAYQRSIMGKYARRPYRAHRWTPRGRTAHTWIGHAGPHAAYWGNRHWRRSRHGRHWMATIAPAPIDLPSTAVMPQPSSTQIAPAVKPLPAIAQTPSTAQSHGSDAGGVKVAYVAPTPTHINVLPSVPSPVMTAPPASAPAPAAQPSIPAKKPARRTADTQVADNAGYDDAGPSVSLDFVAADINDVIKSLAMQTHTNIVSGADVKGDITVTLNNVSLDEALDMITKLSGFSYAKVGKTYVVGSPASIQSLTTSGTASLAPVTSVINLQYSDAAQMETSIKDRYPNVKVTMGNTVGNVSAGGVLIVTGTDDDVAGVKSLVDASETALAHGMSQAKTILYHIKYSSAIDLMAVLSRLDPSLVTTPAPTPGFNLSAPTTADAGGTTSSTANYGSSGSGGASTSTSSNGSSTTTSSAVAVKPNVDAILLTGTDNDINRALDILKTVDIKPDQISYDAKITEISLGKTHDLGLNWDFSGATTRIGETPDQAGTPALTGSNLVKFGVISRTPINDLANVSMDAMFKDSHTKILADPNISAVDGQQAAVFIGDTVEYVSSITQTATGPSVTTASVNVGIKLYVAGKVSDDGYVTVNIHPEVSTISSWLDVPGGGQLPDIASREATTTVRVKDGDYIAIGGLINESDVKTIQKVPGLGDLPFFGSLFRDSQDQKSRDEVVIFVKVSIDKDAA